MIPRQTVDSSPGPPNPFLAAPAKRSSKPKKKGTDDGPEPTLELQSLEDRYSRSSAEQQRTQFEEELSLRLAAERTLHQQKMRALLQQLQMQLFTIWQEIWLQRQKSWSDYQKAWSKVMLN